MLTIYSKIKFTLLIIDLLFLIFISLFLFREYEKEINIFESRIKYNIENIFYIFNGFIKKNNKDKIDNKHIPTRAMEYFYENFKYDNNHTSLFFLIKNDLLFRRMIAIEIF